MGIAYNWLEDCLMSAETGKQKNRERQRRWYQRRKELKNKQLNTFLKNRPLDDVAVWTDITLANQRCPVVVTDVKFKKNPNRWIGITLDDKGLILSVFDETNRPIGNAVFIANPKGKQIYAQLDAT